MIDAPLESSAAQGFDADEAIALLRERSAHRFDAVRFRFIEVLAKRASAYKGDTRCLLDAKLAKLLADYQARFEKAQIEAKRIQDVMAARFPKAGPESTRFYIAGDFCGLRTFAASLEDSCHRSPLADLVHHIAKHSFEENGVSGTARDAVADGASPAELKTLSYFRSTWSMLGNDRRLNQSLAKIPENAGPLNSHVLALRSLKMMRDISPKYLNRFMSYLDALMWLDHANDGGALVQKDVARSEGDKKPKAGRRKSG